MVKDGDNIHHYNGCHVNHDDDGNRTAGFSQFDDYDGDDDSEDDRYADGIIVIMSYSAFSSVTVPLLRVAFMWTWKRKDN